MKVLKSRGFALAVLVLVIVAGSLYGISRKPVAVQYGTWIADDAGLLTAETKQCIEDYNRQWNEKYYAVVAVASVDSTHGKSSENYAAALGKEWGLGQNDMLLLLVKGGDYYVLLGNGVNAAAADTQLYKLKSAIEQDYYSGSYDKATLSFYRMADVVYAQMFHK